MPDLDATASTPSSAPRTYARRRPEESLVYQAVATHFEAFVAFARERSGTELPKYVLNELRRYLACGDLSRGFVRAFCDGCKHSFLVAFSCKCRGICASCATRRMTATAAALIDRVLPDVPYRQWVLTVPHSMRLLLAKDPKVLSAVHKILVTEVERAYLATTDAPGERKGGSVTFVQRFSGSLGLHVHFHLVACDGIFARDDPESAPRFVAAPAPTRATLARVIRRIHDRTLRWLRRHGYIDDRPVEDRSNERPADDAVDACLRIAASQGTLARLPGEHGGGAGHDRDDDKPFAPRTSKWLAEHDGFNLHAGVTVAQGHRTFLERLCRYGARPAFALERLTLLADGTYAYRTKYPLRGKTHRILTPMELMARLCGIIPPPRYPLVRFAGVLASASSWRAAVVPPHPPHRRCCRQHERERERDSQLRARNTATSPRASPASGDCTADVIAPASATASPASTRIPWAQLLQHGFGFDALACRCGRTMRVVAAVTDPPQILRYLRHLGAHTAAPIPTRVREPLRVELQALPPDDWL